MDIGSSTLLHVSQGISLEFRQVSSHATKIPVPACAGDMESSQTLMDTAETHRYSRNVSGSQNRFFLDLFSLSRSLVLAHRPKISEEKMTNV
jgi:hypothetical protein